MDRKSHCSVEGSTRAYTEMVAFSSPVAPSPSPIPQSFKYGPVPDLSELALVAFDDRRRVGITIDLLEHLTQASRSRPRLGS